MAWLAQRTDKTTITRLLRCSWEAVAAIVGRVVADHLDQGRLDGLYRIGVDDVSYRKGHRYLTLVPDHDREGQVVWAGEGRCAATLESFFDPLAPSAPASSGPSAGTWGPVTSRPSTLTPATSTSA